MGGEEVDFSEMSPEDKICMDLAKKTVEEAMEKAHALLFPILEKGMAKRPTKAAMIVVEQDFMKGKTSLPDGVVRYQIIFNFKNPFRDGTFIFERDAKN